MSTPARAAFPKTPVALVTGFLGSGKTTQINLALRDPRMRGALVIVNEFGDVGLDHALMETSSDRVFILENGCLCCTVFGDLVGTLGNLYHRRNAGEVAFDRVVIETSGVADPSSIAQAFLSEPTLEGLYRLTSTVTLVDAVNYAATLRNHDEAVRQLALADHIVLTKLDLAPDREQTEQDLRERVAAINQSATVTRAPAAPSSLAELLVFDGIDPGADAFRWLALETPRSHAAAPHSLDHLPIGTLSYIRDEPLPRRALELLLSGIERNLGLRLLRLKAIVTVEGEDAGPAVIQGAQHLLHNLAWLDHWPFPDRKSRFVLIAAGIGEESLSEMVSMLDRIAARSARARPA